MLCVECRTVPLEQNTQNQLHIAKHSKQYIFTSTITVTRYRTFPRKDTYARVAEILYREYVPPTMISSAFVIAADALCPIIHCESIFAATPQTCPSYLTTTSDAQYYTSSDDHTTSTAISYSTVAT